ncbi:ATP-grasp domain-containing protein [Thermococcus sp. EP1]|uniref:carboxylate--amine ligase n=1 Tax=Thermococcus sp. EP1 TaxID=1591054 RepID=UPI0012E3291D|nr:ATP-grasp domain-containing protein [Thermococcus sp. EP1]
MSSKILITDAQMRSSLAVIRSLGKKGLKITAGEETRFATGFFSKYVKERVVYSSPRKNPKGFIKFLKTILSKDEYEMLIPVADATLLQIIKHKEELEKYTTIPYPDYEKFIKAYDKGKVVKLAQKLRIPVPDTHFVQDSEELNTLAREIIYPVILKARFSFGSRGVRIANSRKELFEKYKELSEKFGNLILLQEYIPKGDEIGVYTLFDLTHKPVAVTVQRRIRSYPVSGGPSTLRETIKGELAEKASKIAFTLLRELKWYGIAMVEFRVDPRDNTPKIMEVNPRFWGSLQLSILAGVDFPYLLYKLFTDKKVEPVLDYKEGVQCRWLLPGDILWFLSSPNKLKNLKEFLKFNTNYDILSLEDPGPTFGFILATLRFLFDKDMWEFVIRRL